jgi:hypothetical protein
MRLRDASHCQRSTVESYALRALDMFAQLGLAAIDGETPFPDPGFDFAA